MDKYLIEMGGCVYVGVVKKAIRGKMGWHGISEDKIYSGFIVDFELFIKNKDYDLETQAKIRTEYKEASIILFKPEKKDDTLVVDIIFKAELVEYDYVRMYITDNHHIRDFRQATAYTVDVEPFSNL